MELQVIGKNKEVPHVTHKTYEQGDFNKIMNECDVNIETVRLFIEKYQQKNYEVPNNDITGTMIKEAVNFSSPFLNHSVEFNDLKNHLVLFYEEQHRNNMNKDYVIPHYHIFNAIMQSLRQLIIELLKETNRKQQILYLTRVFRWFYSKKVAYSVKPIKPGGRKFGGIKVN